MKPATELPLCDLVMKGGVTSGVVYPRLISRLADNFHFKNIGGTSAGAIAAAACAAAEHARRSGKQAGAFRKLAALPEHLGEQVGGRTRLSLLFEPAAALRRHFDTAQKLVTAPTVLSAIHTVLTAGMHKLVFAAVLSVVFSLAVWLSTSFGPWRASLETLVLLAYFVVATGGVAWILQRLGQRILVQWIGGLVAGIGVLAWFDFQIAYMRTPALLTMQGAAIISAFVLGMAVGLWRFFTVLLRELGRNNFGFCSGCSAGGDPDVLVNWLGPYLNDLAGIEGRPLTFGDLWTAGTGTPDFTPKKEAVPPAQRSINLELMTTALSMHTAYALPFRPGLGPFYFSIEEWAPLFPPDVMGWLTQHAEEGPALADGTRLFVLPQGAALPVIVAVRMSLSFPLLLSAMPLYAPDQGHRDKADKPRIKRVWFSDGGLASNLPLHFFDELLPQHPTFAVNLKGEHPAHPIDDKGVCGENGRVYLAQARNGRARFWEDPPEGSLTHFVGSIFKTMHSWRDEALFPYAGYRDRIVQISIRPGEGGLNLSMSPTKIADLAKAGACAGDQLAKRFDPAAPDSGWTEHREVRARTAMGNLALLARNAQAQAGKGHWREAIAQTYRPAEAALAQALLADLEAMGAKVEASSDVDLAGAMRRPHPVLKPVPQH